MHDAAARNREKRLSKGKGSLFAKKLYNREQAQELRANQPD